MCVSGVGWCCILTNSIALVWPAAPPLALTRREELEPHPGKTGYQSYEWFGWSMCSPIPTFIIGYLGSGVLVCTTNALHCTGHRIITRTGMSACPTPHTGGLHGTRCRRKLRGKGLLLGCSWLRRRRRRRRDAERGQKNTKLVVVDVWLHPSLLCRCLRCRATRPQAVSVGVPGHCCLFVSVLLPCNIGLKVLCD